MTKISSSQKGTVLPGVIILAFILMLVVMMVVVALGYAESKLEKACNFKFGLRLVLGQTASDVLCAAIGADTGGRETGTGGEYTYNGGWKCDGKIIDLKSIGKDPIKAFDGGGVTTIYQYDDGSYIGFVGGTRAWRNNNPGNIVKGFNGTNQIGDDGRFAIFNNYNSGFDAITVLLQGKKYSGLTLASAITKYAPPEENDTDSYIANVSKNTGIDSGTKLGTLSDAEIEKIATEIKRIEGFKVGQIKDGCLATPPTRNLVDFNGKMPINPSHVATLRFREDFGVKLMAAIDEAKHNGINIVIYSGNDGKHESDSNHYNGTAADINASGNAECRQKLPKGCDKTVIQIMNNNGLYCNLCNQTFDPKNYPQGDCNHFSLTGR